MSAFCERGKVLTEEEKAASVENRESLQYGKAEDARCSMLKGQELGPKQSQSRPCRRRGVDWEGNQKL